MGEDGAQRRVCVIGAGVSGLVAAKVLLEDDFDVSVFEERPGLGGVWEESRTYPELCTQNPRDTYYFSDHPWPRTADAFPNAGQVREYLRSYAARFGIESRIEFGTAVVRVVRNGPGWRVTVRTADEGASETSSDFDFVVVASGVFSEPNVPDVEGRERFAGLVRHSSEVTDPELVKDRRVVVVGASKSAMDCATWAAQHGRSSTLLFRQAYWMWPRYWGGWLNIQWVMYSRASEALLPHYRLNRFERFLHGPGRPLLALQWRGLERFMRATTGLRGPLLPTEPMPRNYEKFGVGIEPYSYLRRVAKTTFPLCQ